MKDEDLDIIYDQLFQEYGAITFEAFINLLVCSSHSAFSDLEVVSHYVGRYHRGSDIAGSVTRGFPRGSGQ